MLVEGAREVTPVKEVRIYAGKGGKRGNVGKGGKGDKAGKGGKEGKLKLVILVMEVYTASDRRNWR